MLLQHEFEIDADIETSWDLLVDLERIMPCMPGAELSGRDGDDYLGSLKIKVGPLGAHFEGVARFAERDEGAHSAVIVATGKDLKGQTSARASIQARLQHLTAARTRVNIETEVEISGRMAQFGRGVIADVSNRLIEQFVTNLGEEILSPRAQAIRGAEGPTITEHGRRDVNLLSLVLPIVKERYGQAVAGALGGFVLSWIFLNGRDRDRRG